MLNPFVNFLLPCLVLVLACLIAWLVEDYSRRVLPAWLSIPLAVLVVIFIVRQYAVAMDRFEQRPRQWTIEERAALQPGPEGYLVDVGEDGWFTCWPKEGKPQVAYRPEIVTGSHAVIYEFAWRSVERRYRWFDDALERTVILLPPDAKVKNDKPKLPIPAADLPKGK